MRWIQSKLQCQASLTQLVERVAFNHVAVNLIPTDGILKTHGYEMSTVFQKT